MKKIQIVAVLAVVALVLTAGMAFAGSIVNTKHNLASGGATNAIQGDLNEVCIYCHTPHGGDMATAVLWNRPAGTTTFTPYSSGTMTGTGDITGTSIACYTCHDGVTSINSLNNVGGSPQTGTPTFVTGISNLGQDLTNDHPVGVSINNGDVFIKAPTQYARVFSNLVECASCHNAHEQTNPMFLRDNNVGSRMCLDCHVK